jgi:hypothetical protein
MAGESSNFQAWRVIPGVDPHGRSTVIGDELTPRRVAAPPFPVCDIAKAFLMIESAASTLPFG